MGAVCFRRLKPTAIYNPANFAGLEYNLLRGVLTLCIVRSKMVTNVGKKD